MSRSVPRLRVAVAVSLAALALPALSPSAQAADPGRKPLTATRTIASSSTVEGAKSVSGKLAQSDQAVLQRTDETPVNVVVKLDYDAVASYRGQLSGLAATSPSVTGRTLSGTSRAETDYDRYAAGLESAFRAALAARVPAAKVGVSLRTVYGGVAVRLPARDARTLLGLPGVAAVQVDRAEQKTAATVEAAEFMGARAIWSRLGGQATAGRGVILADIDSGIWPEHPFFADRPDLGTPPPTASGAARPCVFGDNPLTAVSDVFVCNRKVIGGRPFLDTYNAVQGGEVYPDSARDSDGHGTHTTSTAAGNVVSSAPIFGVDRGPISGVAPGAWILAYKVCGAEGCYQSDSAAAVQQAILDGASVINFSISGGTNPYSDPVELAFLDAYNAGVLVATSAGNSGPTAGTTNHLSPWTLTVAASTQSREFASTLTVAGDGASAAYEGATLTRGVPTPTPIVLAQNLPGYTEMCATELPAGVAAGKVVACRRGGGIGRVQKGYNVSRGGAVGMILYNQPLQDVETDNHFLPAIHLPDGAAFLAFMAAHPAATASWPDGEKRNGQGDVMAAFSSRGPGGQFLKPDITAPGVQVLAGNTPTPDSVAGGPAGEYYQAIAGTSMSSPNVAGSALLLKALRPDWTPGAIKSALMTSATTAVVKEDLTTPADPFDMGAGRVDLTKAGSVPIVFDETAARMSTIGRNPLTAVNLNLPSVNVPTMPGTVRVTRTATNVTTRPFYFTAETSAPAGARIRVSPSSGVIPAGGSRELTITISSGAPEGQYFGRVDLRSAGVTVHLPVAFYATQGAVTLTQSCDPAAIRRGATTTCTVTAQNNSSDAAAVVATSTVSSGLRIVGASGATISDRGRTASVGPVALAAPKDAIPAVAAGDTPGGGFLDLRGFDIAPEAIGDEDLLNFTVPAFRYGGRSYERIGVVSNGYLVVGGSDEAADIAYTPQTLPDPSRPNGVLAPYWSDLDGGGVDGLRVGVLTDGVSSWIVVQWDVHLYGVTGAEGERAMQVWIGVNGTEDISYGYAASTLRDAPAAMGLTVGAENVTGTAGDQISGPPTGSLVVTTTPSEPGGSVSYTLTVKGVSRGAQTLVTTLESDQVAGTTRVRTRIPVR